MFYLLPLTPAFYALLNPLTQCTKSALMHFCDFSFFCALHTGLEGPETKRVGGGSDGDMRWADLCL